VVPPPPPTPYAWPWDAALTGGGTAIVVVSPSTVIPDSAPAGIVDAETAIYSLASAARGIGSVVIRVVTAPPPTAHAAPFSWFPALAADATTTATGIDGFFGSALEHILRAHRIDRLLLVGAGLETCVHSTMRSANDRGFECLLVRDACLAYDDNLIPSSISMIEMSGGIFGAVGTTPAVLDAFAQLTPTEGTPS